MHACEVFESIQILQPPILQRTSEILQIGNDHYDWHT
jgi:hypothetical protein